MTLLHQLLLKKSPDRTGEQCGLVMKNGEILELPNIHPKPLDAFRIDPTQVVLHYKDAVATWHTHLGPAMLSGADYAMFLNWPDLLHYIVGDDEVKCYKVKDGAIFEEVQ